MARHRRCPVVKDYESHVCPVIDRIKEAGNTGVKEGGVSDGSHNIPLFPCMGKSTSYRDRGTHAYGRIDGSQLEPQGIAADIAWVNSISEDLFNGIEDGPVHASGTEDGWPRGQVRGRLD